MPVPAGTGKGWNGGGGGGCGAAVIASEASAMANTALRTIRVLGTALPPHRRSSLAVSIVAQITA